MAQVMQDSAEFQSRSRYFDVKRAMSPILDEVNKKFNDAIYRMKNNDERTAADVWEDLKKAQSISGVGSAMRCVSFLNELVRRGQIAEEEFRLRKIG